MEKENEEGRTTPSHTFPIPQAPLLPLPQVSVIDEEEEEEVKRRLARLSLVVGPVLVRYPATCRLDDHMVRDVLHAITTAMATTAPTSSAVARLLRLSPMARRLDRAVGQQPGVADLYAKVWQGIVIIHTKIWLKLKILCRFSTIYMHA
jgi:hypothetical protein